MNNISILVVSAFMIGSIYGLLALGYSLIYRASGLMTFVQGDLYMFGAFLGMTFYKILKLPFAVSIIMVILCMFVLGMLIEKYVIRILQHKKAPAIYIVFATIALSIILQNLAMLIWGGTIFQLPPVFNKSIWEFGNMVIVPESMLAFVIAVLLMLLLHLFMTKTKFGTSMRAAAQDPMAAKGMGIDVSWTIGVTWGLAAALAGVAGFLVGPVFGVHFMMGSSVGLKGFAGAVIGGYGNMYGAMLGSAILGIIETFAAGIINSTYKDVLTFAILIIVLVFKPTGIFKSDVYDD